MRVKVFFAFNIPTFSSLETRSTYPSLAKASNQMTDLSVLHTEKHLDNKEGHTLKGVAAKIGRHKNISDPFKILTE